MRCSILSLEAMAKLSIFLLSYNRCWDHGRGVGVGRRTTMYGPLRIGYQVTHMWPHTTIPQPPKAGDSVVGKLPEARNLLKGVGQLVVGYRSETSSCPSKPHTSPTAPLDPSGPKLYKNSVEDMCKSGPDENNWNLLLYLAHFKSCWVLKLMVSSGMRARAETLRRKKKKNGRKEMQSWIGQY